MMNTIRGSIEIPPMFLVSKTESPIRKTNKRKRETEVATTRIKEGVTSPPGPSSYNTLPEELLIDILKIARNPNTRLVSKNFTTATNAAEDELSGLLQEYLKEQAIAQFLEEPLPSDFFSQYPKKRHVELLETLHRNIVLAARASGVLKIDGSPLEPEPSFFFSVEQLNTIAYYTLNYNLCLLFNRLPLPNTSEIHNIDNFVDLREKATEIRCWMEQNREVLEEFTSLDLQNTSLTHLPEELSIYFPNLHELDLSQNKLSSISKNFGASWTELQKLNLEENSIRTLSPHFGRAWSNLIFLYLGRNALTTIPQGFGTAWQNLCLLSLEHNKLCALCHDFGAFWDLQDLYLGSNRLKNLPENFGCSWTDLRELDLSDNQLSSLPEYIGINWRALLEFDLKNNQLVFLPEGFGKHCSSLSTLALENNQIKNLPTRLLSGATIYTTIQIIGSALPNPDIFVRGSGIWIRRQLEDNTEHFSLNWENGFPLTHCEEDLGKITIAYENLDEAQLQFYLNDIFPELSGIRLLPQNQTTPLMLFFPT